MKHMNWKITNSHDGKFIGKGRLDNHAAALDWQFRILDDDDEVLYEGVCEDPSSFSEPEGAFDPLDWAVGDGATTMEYRKDANAKWRIL